MTVLHFFTLPELAGELGPGDVVRVETAVQSRQTKTPSLGMRIVDVHARAIAPVPDGGEGAPPTILVFMLNVGHTQTIHGRPASETDADHLEAETGRADRAIKSYLEARGLMVRPGLIDIGAAEPVRGTLDGLEIEAVHDAK